MHHRNSLVFCCTASFWYYFPMCPFSLSSRSRVVAVTQPSSSDRSRSICLHSSSCCFLTHYSSFKFVTCATFGDSRFNRFCFKTQLHTYLHSWLAGTATSKLHSVGVDKYQWRANPNCDWNSNRDNSFSYSICAIKIRFELVWFDLQWDFFLRFKLQHYYLHSVLACIHCVSSLRRFLFVLYSIICSCVLVVFRYSDI